MNDPRKMTDEERENHDRSVDSMQNYYQHQSQNPGYDPDNDVYFTERTTQLNYEDLMDKVAEDEDDDDYEAR